MKEEGLQGRRTCKRGTAAVSAVWTGCLPMYVYVYVTVSVCPSALFYGIGPALVLVSNPAIQFMVYELLKKNLGHTQPEKSQTDAREAGVRQSGLAHHLSVCLCACVCVCVVQIARYFTSSRELSRRWSPRSSHTHTRY